MNLEAALKHLQERARTDEAFLQEIKSDPEGALAREAGVSPEAVRQYARPLGDNELAAVAGGLGQPGICSKCKQKFGSAIGAWLHEELWCTK